MEDRTLLSTFLVNNTADSGPGSLRQAIFDSNASTEGNSVIDFTIAGGGVQTIAPLSPLPAITASVLIDGTSQPGYTGMPLVELSGNNLTGGGDGLTITGSDVTIRGLDINGFTQGAGIHISGTGATNNWIYADFLGTDPTGTQDLANYAGVEIDRGATNNLIGTNGDGIDDASEQNLLSGNLFAGVWITGQGTIGNAVAGNFIGTDITGSVALNNGTQTITDSQGNAFSGGVVIAAGASGNRIGTDGDSVDDVGERNVIAGSSDCGVAIQGAGTDGNIVAGNFIGTDVTGTVALGVAGDGVFLDDGASYNSIGVNPDGGTAVRDLGNVISGTGHDGVDIYSGSNGNVVAGNRIGTDVTGTLALGNVQWGISIFDSAGDIVGGLAPGAGNVISGNSQGVTIFGGRSVGDVVQGNMIGTDVTGTNPLGNLNSGVYVGDWFFPGYTASNATIGGTTAGAGNVISANGKYGVWITGAGATGNVVEGNLIGTGITGTEDLGNASGGVQIDGGASGNTIGGATAEAGNLITDNGRPGVVVGSSATDTSTIGNQITANRIFGNAGQAIDLGDDGVTYNSTTPRQGPNNFQNFPVVVATADGQYDGWLGGSTPNTTFRIDLFASAAYGPGGSGEAQDYLGSLEVTTDATGQVSFAVPFAAPADLPVITATATDQEGNTSELSAVRRPTLQAPALPVRAVANQSLAFATKSGDGIAIEDPDAGLLDPVWSLTLSVSDGTLTLSTTAGLTGSGDGTGSLSYSGPLTTLDAALEGMMFNPPAGPQVQSTLTLGAQSQGAPPLQTQFVITDGVLVVDTTADSGPGSLRQAILDANSVAGLAVTIDFAIPGAGVQTIVPITPLPRITASVLIDGTTQPGFAGAPLIELRSAPAGGPAALTIAGPGVTVRGLAIDQFSFDPTTNEILVAQVHPQGLTTQLSLLDSQGQLLVQSDGISPTDPDDLIAQQVVSGSYFLKVDSTGGAGIYTLTTTVAPTTAPFQPLPGFSGPDAIMAGDFTGDGRLDLAVANEYSDDVSILLGNGDGTFQPQVTYAVGSYPTAIVAGDFTGDGHLDLAVANSQGSTVSVLLGNGDGTFQPQVTYAVGSVPRAIVAGDFSGDGHLDLAVANSLGNSVSVLLGNGDGTFQPQVTYAVGSVPLAIVAGDFTGDGHLDLAVANSNFNYNSSAGPGSVSVLLGTGDGTFEPQVTYAVGLGPSGIVAGDFTRDGHVDLAVANENIFGTGPGTVSVLLGNGDGTFQPQVTYAVGSGPSAIVAGDFTGDGRTGLAVSNFNDNTVSVLLGNGDGTFQPQATYTVGTYPGAIVAGDFTADGHPDLAAANSGDNTVSVLLGNGDGTFQPQSETQNAVGVYQDAIAAGDFTGDGRTDLAVANTININGPGSVSVLLGNGDGTFEPAVQYAVGSDPYAIVTGDFNGDGRADLAVVNEESNDVSILLGNGDGTFRHQVTYAVGSGPDAVVAGDFTGDGHLDLAVANSDGTVSVLLGNGDGTFQPQVTYAVGSGPDAIAAGDFTGDGHLDLAVANGDFSGSGGTVSVLLGNGDGTFQPQVTYAVGSNPDAIVAGAFTGDGHLDLAVANSNFNGSGPGSVSVLLGNGDGTFQHQVTYAAGSYPDAIVASDFTGDGHLDLAVANAFDNTVSVLVGNGDGTFQPQVTYTVGSNPASIVAGDFNRRTGLATANLFSNNVSVLLGNGDGTFEAPGQFATTPSATPLVADVNGDGTNDVLVVDGAGAILYRQGIPGQPGVFEPPVTVNPPLADGSNPYTSRDIAWLPNIDQGPVLASVDTKDNAISFYAYRDGGFVRLSGSLTTGQLPAQIIAADLSGDGLTDLVVRNAGDGTLSVYFGSQNSNLLGPPGPPQAPTFLPPVTLPVGLGVSDVQAVDTTGSGALDLVVTNELTGQVSVLRNLGDGTFAPPVPYRAGIGLSAIDPGSTPEVTSLDASAGVAAGPLTPGGPTDLVTINPGSDTVDVLVGLGGGRFANPVTLPTQGPAQVVRVGDFTGNGVDDLAVLTSTGVSIYLGNGGGGFLPPTTYASPSEADGLTVADLTGNGKLDLLVGDAFGDVLVLLGNGNGTFEPYHEANQAIELAVADLTGNGSKDVIYADQGLDRVVVDYGASQSTVLADQSTGLLDPGFVALADLNGSGTPDLIVANSASNNVLVYPGLGNGQFGPAINGGHGYFVGTDPVGITVANLTGDLPDLVVADKGSNQVSILLNQSQQGGNISFSAGPRLNSGGSGPVSTVVGNFTGGAFPDILVTNSGTNDVALLPGVGAGFFNDTNPQTLPVGSDPGPLFAGRFDGKPDLLTVDTGSNNLTLISDFMSADSITSTILSGGTDPDTAFSFSSSSGFENLVVGNGGDGVLALFEGSAAGLSLTSSATMPGLPSPTDLALSAITGGQVQFYAATAGREAAELVALSLGVETGTTSQFTTAVPLNTVAQLVPLSESSLPLVATVLTSTIELNWLAVNVSSAETGLAMSGAFLPGTGISVGQGLSLPGPGSGPTTGDRDELLAPDDMSNGWAPAAVSAWERTVFGLDEAWAELSGRMNAAAEPPAPSAASAGQQSTPPAPLAAPPVAPPYQAGEYSGTGAGAPGAPPLDKGGPGGVDATSVAPRGVDATIAVPGGVEVHGTWLHPAPSPPLSTVDAALAELGRPTRHHAFDPWHQPMAAGEPIRASDQRLLGAAAASLTLSLAWERGIAGARSWRKASRVGRGAEGSAISSRAGKTRKRSYAGASHAPCN